LTPESDPRIITLMRYTAFVVLVALGTAASAWAAAGTIHPYRIPPTRRCLTHHGAHLLPRKDEQATPSTISWDSSKHDSSGLPIWVIDLDFWPSPPQAASYERGMYRDFRRQGASKRWIRHHLTRRGNVVIEKDIRVNYPLTAKQIATIDECLHR